MLKELLDNKEKQLYLLMKDLSKKKYGLTINELCLAHNKTRKTIMKYLNELEQVLDHYSGIFLIRNGDLYCIEKEPYVDIRNIYTDFFLKSKKKIILECIFKGESTKQIISRVRHNHWSYSASRVALLEIEEFFKKFNIDLKTLNNKANIEMEIYFRIFFYTIQSSVGKKKWLFDYTTGNQLTELVTKIEKEFKLTLSKEEKVRLGYMIAIANERVELGFGLQGLSILFESMEDKNNTTYKKFKDCLSTSPFYKLSEAQEATVLYNLFYFCFTEFYDPYISIKSNEKKKYIELFSYKKINKKKLLFSYILPGDFYKSLPVSRYVERFSLKIVGWLNDKKYVVANKEKTAFSLLEESTYNDHFIMKICVITNFDRTMEEKFIDLLCFYYPFQLKRICSKCHADIIISSMEIVSDSCEQWVITSTPTMDEVEKELVPLLEKIFFKKLAKLDYLKQD